MVSFIGGSIKEREAREEQFRKDTLFANLMTGQTVLWETSQSHR